MGTTACGVIRSLTAELELRGASMFQALAHEVPWLRDGASQTHAAARRALTDAFTVHILLDETVDWARAFRALLMGVSSAGEEEEGVRRALASMVYAMMKGAGLGVAPARLGTLSLSQVTGHLPRP